MNASAALSRPVDRAPHFARSLQPAHALPAPALERSVYGQGRRVDPVAAVAAIAFASAAFLSFAFIGGAPRHPHEHRLKVIDLMAMPDEPPPPAAPEPHKAEAPPTAQPALVLPPPVVQNPSAPAMVAASEPAPPEVVKVVAASGPPAPEQRAAGPADVGDLSSKMVAATPPRYPLDSRRLHEQGTVVLQVLLGPDGSVSEISVAHSSGFDRLDRAALGAVRHWRWSPTLRAGEVVSVRGLVTIPFVLRT